jgi:hypothetical protein
MIDVDLDARISTWTYIVDSVGGRAGAPLLKIVRRN